MVSGLGRLSLNLPFIEACTQDLYELVILYCKPMR
jgi:hypothetical protein